MLILPFLAAVAVAAPDPVVVTGHAWAPFISPMGEPFRRRDVNDDPVARWFAGADKDGNGTISETEMIADADRFFSTIDENVDGKIDPTEMMHYEWEIAPDVQMGSMDRYAPGEKPPVLTDKERRKRDRDEDAVYEGGARYSLLNIPQPVAAADYDFDRDVTHAEFRRAASERFLLLYNETNGSLTLAALQKKLPTDPGAREKRAKDARDRRVGNGLPSKD